MHLVSEPPILYFGTPVVLVSTVNEDGSVNLAPISSVFWLGWRCMIGISAFSKTTANLLRTGECVLNLPSVNEVAAVDRLALTTGSNPVPEGKRQKGYRHEKDKFRLSGLAPAPSLVVDPPRVLECPVQLEAVLMAKHPLADEDPAQRNRLFSLELRIVKVHLSTEILMEGQANKVDPHKWRPLIMSFQKFYGLGAEVHPSRLSSIPESSYQMPDLVYAREAVNR